jgi:hypothetical protein
MASSFVSLPLTIACVFWSLLKYDGVNQLTSLKISEAADKILRFQDLCGHEHYLEHALYAVFLVTRMLSLIVCRCTMAYPMVFA